MLAQRGAGKSASQIRNFGIRIGSEGWAGRAGVRSGAGPAHVQSRRRAPPLPSPARAAHTVGSPRGAAPPPPPPGRDGDDEGPPRALSGGDDKAKAGATGRPLLQPRRGPSPASHPSPTGPALRANPYPEVTDLTCRLPLPTLF